jgi:hypothetical protein
VAVWNSMLESTAQFGHGDHLRALVITALVPLVVLGLAIWLVPSACHTRAGSLLTQWGCLLPLTYAYVSPVVALLWAAVGWDVERRRGRHLGWLPAVVLSALVAQLLVAVTMYGLAGAYLRFSHLLEFLIFPQAPIAGGLAGLTYWLTLRARLPGRARQ